MTRHREATIDDPEHVDQTVTLRGGRRLGFAAQIPDCTATFVPGAGHMLFYTHFAAILAQIAEPAA